MDSEAELEPTVSETQDQSETVDTDAKRWTKSRLSLIALVPIGIVLVTLFDLSFWRVLSALLMGWLIFRAGLGALGAFARPVPEPPPPGELRRVKIQFRCSICGAEVRMTAANDEVPEPPRHCLEDMDLVAPVE